DVECGRGEGAQDRSQNEGDQHGPTGDLVHPAVEGHHGFLFVVHECQFAGPRVDRPGLVRMLYVQIVRTAWGGVTTSVHKNSHPTHGFLPRAFPEGRPDRSWPYWGPSTMGGPISPRRR